MQNGKPDFQVKFSAKDDGTFGTTVRKVKADLMDITKSLAMGVTGGIIGGSAVGAVMAVVDKALLMIQETAKLTTMARGLSIGGTQARGMSTNAKLMGLDPDKMFAGISTLDQRRADALAGDEGAIESFKRLGLSLKEIKDLKPEDLFYKVGNRLEGVFDANKKLASADLFGSSANDLVPYFAKNGGDQFRPNSRQTMWKGLLGWAAANIPGVTGAIVGASEIMNGGNPYTSSVDTVSTVTMEREKMAAKMATQNRERSIDLVRSQLPLEQQLTLAMGERLKIERELSTVTDPVKRERMVGRLLDLNATILGARNSQMAAQTAPTGATWTRNLDDLSRAGIFTGGSPSVFIDLAKQQLSEARKHTDLLRTTPAEIAKSI